MSVVSVTENIGTRRGEETRDEQGEVTRTYEREFFVKTDTPEGAATVRSADGIPRLGTPYAVESDYDDSSLVRRIRAEQYDRTALLWKVTVEYSTNSSEGDDPEPDDPTREPPEIDWGYETVQEPLRVWKGESVGQEFEGAVNSAGEPFVNPPILVDKPILVLRVSRNETRFDPVNGLNFFGAVNDAPFMGFPAGSAMLAGMSSTKAQKKGKTFDRVSYTFKFRDDGWQTTVLDHGSYYLNDERIKVDFLTKAGHPTTGNLDGSGGALDPEGAVLYVFKTFNTRPSRAFGDLRLF